MSQKPSPAPLLDCHPPADAFLEDVVRGLSQPQKTIPSKYFYDERGSELFDQICELPEYYPTRTEIGILRDHAAELTEAIGPRCMLIEPGSGSGLKTRLLLELMRDPIAYVPIEIAREYLRASVAELAERFPEIQMLPVCADFSDRHALPEPDRPAERRAVFFPGSTIGNFHEAQRADLLHRMAELAGEGGEGGEGGAVILGLDLQKDRETLEAAYNDAAGVTAAFNMNLLHRANRELGADFDPDGFEHRAPYNAEAGRIEMHLVARRPQTIHLGGHTFEMRTDESILTEYSYKFRIEPFAASARAAGLRLRHTWTDDRQRFAVLHLVAEGSGTAEG